MVTFNDVQASERFVDSLITDTALQIYRYKIAVDCGSAYHFRFLEHLPEGEPLYPADYVTDQPERFFAAEIVREKLLQFTHAEIPFSSAVVVDRFERGYVGLRCCAPIGIGSLHSEVA